MSERVWPVVAAAVGVAAGLALLLPVDDDDGAEPAADPVEGFVAAYERSRTATFAAEQTFTRTAPDGGASITYERRLVQRPPDDRLLVGGGNAEGRLDGFVVRCSTGPGSSGSCMRGLAAPDDAAGIAAEVATLRSLVDGDAAAYDVDPSGDGCWVLTLVAPVVDPPYGTEATFCFDAATGAPLRVEVVRDEATDVVVTTAVRSDVTDADLGLGDLGELPAPS